MARGAGPGRGVEGRGRGERVGRGGRPAARGAEIYVGWGVPRGVAAAAQGHLSAVQALRLDLIEEDIPAHFVGALRRLAELARRAEVERLLRKNDLTSLTDEEKTRLREIWRDRQTADETDA